ncbi:hypothetical protein [Agromyces sp. NPDC058064]|uniref:hypothetical protein n=1 Tax=Agromyces sp. NPDC058064 TaxID=3346322 RepID=UPI0036DDFCB3
MDITFSLPPAMILGLIVSTVLPLLVGLVTKTVTSPAAKAILLAILAAVLGVLTELLAAVQAGTSYDIGRGVLVALVGFLVAVGMHFGLWKPTGAAQSAQRIGDPAHRA